MKKLWKSNKQPIILSLLAAAVILAADISSRAYFAVGGGGMVMAGVITYWIYRLVEGVESHEIEGVESHEGDNICTSPKGSFL